MASKVVCHWLRQRARGVLRAARAQRGLHRGYQHLRLHRLDQVAVRAALQPLRLVGVLTEDALTCTTGMRAVAGSALIRRHTSKPFMSGRLTSSSTRSGVSAATRPSASLAGRGLPHTKLGAFEDARNDVPTRGRNRPRSESADAARFLNAHSVLQALACASRARAPVHPGRRQRSRGSRRRRPAASGSPLKGWPRHSAPRRPFFSGHASRRDNDYRNGRASPGLP